MSAWMTAKQAAEESPRHYQSVVVALQRGLLKGKQGTANGVWTIRRTDFDRWAAAGFPLPQLDRVAS